MNSLKINTTDEELHQAYLLMDKGRGKQVSITRDLLVHIALDHTSMVRALDKLGVRVVAADSNT
tara:strand:+ start:613 stop:804 length:192 start_codon:yes stop_codon:yes gene_type:complete